jgi:hypothetical protein
MTTYADRRRATEDDYFRKCDGELMEELRRREERDAARQRTIRRLGAEAGCVQELEELGFTDSTMALLHVVPLVHVAWAEGIMSASAHRHLIGAARDLGIQQSSVADRQLTEWLRSRPSDALLGRALDALGTLLQRRTRSEQDDYVGTLLERCTAVASASGGVLGFGKISRAEREALDRIRRALSRRGEHTATD